MTDTPPVCQWCQQPITGTPAQWDGRPQCADPIRCERRRRAARDADTPADEGRRDRAYWTTRFDA